jgi:hypothetical protein
MILLEKTMGGGLSAERVDINTVKIIKSWQLDCTEPKIDNVLETKLDVLGYYGQPCDDVQDYDTYRAGILTCLDELDNTDDSDAESDPELLDHPVSVCYHPVRVYTMYDYPLARTVFCRFDVDQAQLTNGQLLYLHALGYQEIYNREDDAVHSKGEQVKNISGMLNRDQTNGPFGIWGHSIGDLVYNGGKDFPGL